ncbi:MAG: aminopeptidase [Bacilli bacterium]
MNKTKIKKYAELIVNVGANVQKGQDVIIFSSVQTYEFVKLLTYYAYKRKARSVEVIWSYDDLSIYHSKYCSLKTLSTVPNHVIEKQKYYVETNPARIYILSEDPDSLKGMDQEKVMKANQIKYPILKPFKDQMENRYQWVIAGYPSYRWAKKVFPNMKKQEAYNALFEAILKTSRADNDNPIEAWKKHNENLIEKVQKLNSLHLKELHYKANNGTDFTVGLIENAQFLAGKEKALGSNIEYNPNIPSEEVFTTPKKGMMEGVVYSSKPLSYNGELIEDFYLVFKEGKVVEAHAKKNEQLLNQMVNMDDSSGYLGEVALVPFDSPINNTNILFFNTLYDENASCHLALGMGFDNTIKDYEKYSKEEIKAFGVNDSMIHVDFMIGTKDLMIEGTTFEGQKVLIFKDGNWAI